MTWYTYRPGHPHPDLSIPCVSYNNVVLHVSMWNDMDTEAVINQSGRKIVRLELNPHLTVPLKKVVALVDVENYPSCEQEAQGRCANVLSKLAGREASLLLRIAGEWRMVEKARRLRGWSLKRMGREQ